MDDPSQEVISKEEGLRLLKAGEIENAIEVLEKVCKKAEDAQACAFLGAAYSQKGDRLRAIHSFEESLRIEETPRNYFNLARMYETCGRIDEAVREYKMATDLDPNYGPAKEAVDRLRSQFATTHPQAQPEPEPQAAEPTQAVATADASQTQTLAGPPPSGPMIGQAPTPQVDPYAQQQTQQNGVQELYARQMAKQQAVADQHHLMMKNGLAYGVICGSIFFVCASLCMRLFIPTIAIGGTSMAAIMLYILVNALIGGAYGCIVGLWIGYTCGGDSAGMQAGAAIGAFLGLLLGLLCGSIGAAVLFAVIFGILSGVVGMLIGRMVDASLPI